MSLHVKIASVVAEVLSANEIKAACFPMRPKCWFFVCFASLTHLAATSAQPVQTRLFAWGGNGDGNLGDGSLINRYVPTTVSVSGVLAGKNVVSMSAGIDHSVALCSDGTLATWGSNAFGQLGNNSSVDSAVPVAVDRGGVLSGKTIISVSAGHFHNYALCSDGTVAAWGLNTNGQLGNNSTTQSNVPTSVYNGGVLAGRQVTSISAGEYHAVARCSDGTIVTWGHNGHGQLGINSTVNSTVPVAVITTSVLSGRSVTAVAAGGLHSLALCSDGGIVAWGRNNSGQLGDGSLIRSNIPVAVSQSGVLSGKTVVKIAGGAEHNIALCSDGTLVGWGSNLYGQLGDGNNTGGLMPVRVNQSGVLAGRVVNSLALGANHSMALCSDGLLVAWGINSNGRLGNNSTQSSTVPVAVYTGNLGPGGTFTIAAAGTFALHSLAVATLGPPPAVSSIDPNPVPTSASQQIVTINGSNFVNKPTVTLTWTGQPGYTVPSAQVTYLSASQLQMAITVGTVADNWTVKVTNPDGQVSNTVGFQVINNLPASPSFLAAQVFSDHVLLGWSDNSTNETGFKIERRTGAGTYSQIATRISNPTDYAFYTDNTSSPRTTYSYRVRAYNAYGDSGYASDLTVTTPGGPPGAFTLSNDSPVWDASIPGPKVQLNWAASADVGNYTVYRNGTIRQGGISANSFTDSAALTGGTSYTYFIRASNADGTTDSNTISVTMPTPVLAPEIAVEQPLNTNIADGGSKSFGAVVVGANTSLTFTIKNMGTANLTGLTVTKDGTHSSQFAVIANPSSTVASGTNTAFTVRFSPSSVGTKSAVIHISSNDTDESPFDITLTGSGTELSSVPTGLVIVGPSVCPSQSSVSFQALLQQSSGGPLDVTQLVIWDPVGEPIRAGGLERSVMVGNRLVTGLLTPADPTVRITATYSYVGGQIRSAAHPITIGTSSGLGVGMSNPAVTYVQPSGPNFKWHVQSSTYGQAAITPGTTWQWFWDDQLVGTSSSFSENITTQPVTHTLRVVATAPNGLVGTDSRRVSLTRPSTSEPGQRFPALAMQGAKFLDASGANFEFASARKQNGLVVLVHGMENGPEEPWIQNMAKAIEARMETLGKIPNIVIYGWKEEADPNLFFDELPAPGFLNRLVKGYRDVVSASPLLGDFFTNVTLVLPNGVAQGIRLESWIRSEINLGHIDASSPIHLIGHSAGGFAVGETAYRLKQGNNPVYVSMVTMLDTPLPIPRHIKDTPDPTRVERYISSIAGEISIPVLNYDQNFVRVKTIVPLLQLTPFNFLHDHSYAHDWYTETIQNKDANDGFSLSPLLTQAAGAMAPASLITRTLKVASEGGMSASATTQPQLSGFTTFGSVAMNGTAFNLTEGSNAGIQKTMTLPIGSESLKFNYSFTGNGDGEFIVVYFGDSPPLFISPNIQPEAAETRTAEVTLAGYEGQSGTLVIKLVGQGEATAIATLDQIELVENDDIDADGLTQTQEANLGTDPLSPDTDSDGLFDLVETTTTPQTNPLLPDSDFDGMDDAAEAHAGTNAVDANSRFQVVQTQRSGGSFLLSWSGVAGKTYQVHRSTEPGFGSYIIVATGLTGVVPQTTYVDSALGAPVPERLFYRVRVE